MELKDYSKLLSIVLENNAMLKQNNAMLKKMIAEKQKEKLTPKEVQEMIGVGKTTYQRYVANGVFEQKKICGKAYVMRSDIEKLISEGKI